MAHHDEYVELISAAIDGALSPAEQTRLDAHLASCPDCKALYDDLEKIQQALSALPAVEIPAGLTERLLSAVQADKVTPLPVKKSALPWKRWAATAAVLALLLLGAGGMGLLNSGRELTAPTSESAETVDPTLARSLPGEEEVASLPADDVQVKAAAESQPLSPDEVPSLILNTTGDGVAPAPSALPGANPGWDTAPMPAPATSGENPEGDTAAIPPVGEPGTPADAPTGYLVNPMTQMPVIPVPSGLDIPDSQDEEVPENPEIGVISVDLENDLTEEEQGAHAALERLEENPQYWTGPLSIRYPAPENPDKDGPFADTVIYYEGLSENGAYYLFRCCFDHGDHYSLITYYAVPLDGGEILMDNSASFWELMGE